MHKCSPYLRQVASDAAVLSDRLSQSKVISWRCRLGLNTRGLLRRCQPDSTRMLWLARFLGLSAFFATVIGVKDSAAGRVLYGEELQCYKDKLVHAACCKVDSGCGIDRCKFCCLI